MRRSPATVLCPPTLSAVIALHCSPVLPRLRALLIPPAFRLFSDVEGEIGE